MTIYEISAYILIYSFLGWCVEVIYHTVTYGEFSNRGFVNGPVCTIYGFGFTGVVLCLTPIKDNLLVLFVGSVLLATLLELVTGWLLERIFHEKWWDYSNDKFNFRGYICLKFSLLWGLACTAVLLIVHPLIAGLVARVPKGVGIGVVVACTLVWIADNIVTVVQIRKINIQLRILREMTENVRKLSDYIGENLHETTVSVMEKAEEGKERREERREEWQQRQEKQREEWQEKLAESREKLLAGRAEWQQKLSEFRASYTSRRLHRAFPGLKLEKRFDEDVNTKDEE